jgi:hypothetical protein
MTYANEDLIKAQNEAIVSVLNTFGPLNFEALRVFVTREYNIRLTVSDIVTAMKRLSDVCGIDPTLSVVFLLDDDSREPSVPFHQDYVVAFYELAERYKFVKSISDLRDMPESIISDLQETAKG